MDYTLNDIEVRILGSLVEKEMTTPDQYPLTVKALTAACNQKSNREPVMSLSESAVNETVRALERRMLVRERDTTRVPRYAHSLRASLTRASEFKPADRAVLASLFLRGPLTMAELRLQAGRMHTFIAAASVESVLQRLLEHEDGPFVMELPRRAGQREVRFAHLFSGEEAALASAPEGDDAAPRGFGRAPQDERLTALEARVEQLESQVARLLAALGGVD